MARVGAPHGVRGEVKLTVFAEDPLLLRRYNPFATADGRTIKITRVKAMGRAIVAAIEGVEDRGGAAALGGAELTIPRARLPRTADDEFYHVDLVGLEARLSDGTPVGRVFGVADHGAGDVLDVRGARSVLVPFTRAVVPKVDLQAGTLTIEPAPGLFDDAAQPEADAEPAADDAVAARGEPKTDRP